MDSFGVPSHTTGGVLDEKRETGRDQVRARRWMLNWLADAGDDQRRIKRENRGPSQSIWRGAMVGCLRREPIPLRDRILLAPIRVRPGYALSLEAAISGFMTPGADGEAVKWREQGEHCQQANRDLTNLPHPA
jgi:hypothetical protein